jgi:hypothetical protein
MDGITVLLAQWAALGGFGALIAFIVNILKTFGLVKDNQAVTWSTGLNLLGLAGLLAVGVYAPQLDVAGIDSKVAQFVQVGLVVFAYIVQLLGAKLGHTVVRGVPLIGKSYSK